MPKGVDTPTRTMWALRLPTVGRRVLAPLLGRVGSSSGSGRC